MKHRSSNMAIAVIMSFSKVFDSGILLFNWTISEVRGLGRDAPSRNRPRQRKEKQTNFDCQRNRGRTIIHSASHMKKSGERSTGS